MAFRFTPARRFCLVPQKLGQFFAQLSPQPGVISCRVFSLKHYLNVARALPRQNAGCATAIGAVISRPRVVFHKDGAPVHCGAPFLL
jgi:hypothetical protein